MDSKAAQHTNPTNIRVSTLGRRQTRFACKFPFLTCLPSSGSLDLTLWLPVTHTLLAVLASLTAIVIHFSNSCVCHVYLSQEENAVVCIVIDYFANGEQDSLCMSMCRLAIFSVSFSFLFVAIAAFHFILAPCRFSCAVRGAVRQEQMSY